MAIEKMVKATIVCLRNDDEKIRDFLMQKGMVQIKRLDAGSLDEDLKFFKNPESNIDAQNLKIAKINFILGVEDKFYKEKKSFVDSFVNPKIEVEENEIKDSEKINIDGIFEELKEIDSKLKSFEKEIDGERKLLTTIEKLDYIPFSINEVCESKYTFSTVGKIKKDSYKNFETLITGDKEIGDFIHIELIREGNKEIDLLIIGLKEIKDKILEFIQRNGFVMTVLPEIEGTIKENIGNINKEISALFSQYETEKEKIKDYLQYRKMLYISLDRALNDREKEEVRKNFLQSKKSEIIEGYLKDADKQDLRKSSVGKFPAISMDFSECEIREDVPVELKNNKIIKPVEFLLRMFGYPQYYSLDPTLFLFFIFIPFFGICFGDVIYGAMLIVLSMLMMRKYKRDDGLKEFMTLFVYAGISCVIFGLIFGSWAGNLVSKDYLPKHNILLRIRNKFLLLDPLEEIMVALLISIGIGVLTQYFGILLKIVTKVKQKDIKSAIYDGFLWYPYLTGMMLIVYFVFGGKGPKILSLIGWISLAGGAIGLILTQGRDEKTFLSKYVIGCVSLYGIMGTYGASGFIGDIVSYSRLLALALTTSLVGLSFNKIAFLINQPKWLVFIFTPLILIGGHLFNFLMSIIGSFVHPARLMFLEFFNRFYEGGAKPFKPFAYRNTYTRAI